MLPRMPPHAAGGGRLPGLLRPIVWKAAYATFDTAVEAPSLRRRSGTSWTGPERIVR
jgi:hypothetical protein